MSPSDEITILLESLDRRMGHFDEVILKLPQSIQDMADRVCSKVDERLKSQRALCEKEFEVISGRQDTFEEWALKYAADEGKKAGEDLPDLPGEERVKSIKRYLKIGSLPILIISSCIGLGILFSSILSPEIFISTFSAIIPQ